MAEQTPRRTLVDGCADVDIITIAVSARRYGTATSRPIDWPRSSVVSAGDHSTIRIV